MDGISIEESYPFGIIDSEPLIVDWEPAIIEITADVQGEVPIDKISMKFHNTLTEMIVRVAKIIDEEEVVLSGGCFQNRYLSERTISRLESEGFKPYWHERIPPNDGGIAFGQVIAAVLIAHVCRSSVF